MARSPQEVFQHHAEALGAGDLDGIVEDYSDDAVFITPDGVKRGKAGIREAFTKLLADVPNADWALPTQIYEGDVLFLEWTATAQPRPRSRTGSTRSSSGTGRSGCRRFGTRCSTRAEGGAGNQARSAPMVS